MTVMQPLFPAQVYADRLAYAQQLCRSKTIDGLVIGAGAQLEYLIGVKLRTFERLTALVIPASGTPTLIVPAVDRGELARVDLGELGIDTCLWVDGQQPHQLTVAALPPNVLRVGIGADLTADHLLALQALLGPQCETLLATTVLAELFIRKDPAEIAALTGAAEAIDRVLAQVPPLLQPGVSEAAVATQLAELILVEHQSVDFVIVGSAENGANPHHSFSDRQLGIGDVVVVDIGGTFGPGYHSDCTRTFIVGGADTTTDSDFLCYYQALVDAQAAARAAIRPGVTAASIDQVAREILVKAGLGEYFIHRTGHGIGLSTHEEPFIAADNQLVLEPGMVFSVEPGFYLPGKYGARIEDIVLVTDTGCQSLNNQPRELL